MRRAALVASLWLTCVLGACDAAATHGWSLRFVDGERAELAATVEALVLEGGCDGAVVYRADVPLDMSGPMPPRLAEGRWGFAGEARDARCATIARGCVEVVFPPAAGSRVVIPLETIDEPPVCSTCVAGRCEGGGASDAGFVPVDAGSPPPPVCDVSHEGSCYRLSTETRTWAAAEDACVAWGGHLVMIESREEDELLQGMGSVWIGLNDRATEGEFVWIDGSPLSYARWSSGAPRTSPPTRDCVRAGDDGWVDGRCDRHHRSLCER